MPQRICLACGKWLYYRNTKGSSAPRVCACGGDLVHRLKHPSTFAEQLGWCERHLAYLRAQEPSPYRTQVIERTERKRARLAELLGLAPLPDGTYAFKPQEASA